MTNNFIKMESRKEQTTQRRNTQYKESSKASNINRRTQRRNKSLLQGTMA